MVIMADSGSTKTHWRLIKGRHIDAFKTAGFNPFFYSTEMMVEEVKRDLLRQVNGENIKQVFFYCAGCSSVLRNRTIYDALKILFPNAEVFVDHDLMAAARATCGDRKGITCILGTGSNSCLYDGSEIVDNIPALSYILGDEGSGAYFGKELIKLYLYRELPPYLQKKFTGEFQLDKEIIFQKVYHDELPNRFLASLAPFLSENIKEPVIKDTVYHGLEEFITRHVMKYEDHEELPVHFIGSIASVFKSILTELLDKNGLKPGVIIRNPVENLVQYHLRKLSD